MSANFVLIDYECIQPTSLDLLAPEHFRVINFVGANQLKLPFEFVASMQSLGIRGEYVKVSDTKPNALDFHIAYYIGALAAAEPSAYFDIMSRDAGFDPLIEHLRNKRIHARRVQSIGEIQMVKIGNAKSPEERIRFVADRLAQSKASKPRTIKTLSSSIAAFFLRQLSEAEVAAIVAGLIKQGIVVMDGMKVSYTAEPALAS